jgi:hypothetical protein
MVYALLSTVYSLAVGYCRARDGQAFKKKGEPEATGGTLPNLTQEEGRTAPAAEELRWKAAKPVTGAGPIGDRRHI